MLEQLATLLDRLRKEKPLVHHITNDVVKNFTANGTLAIGASPVMSSEPREAADMVTHAGALVLNTGTLTDESVAAMNRAGKTANQQHIPVVLDPVGYGTTPYRNDVVEGLLQDIHIAVVRANAAEIAALCGQSWGQKGVDADEDGGNREALAHRFTEQYGTAVAITGAQDVISDGVRTVTIGGGDPLLSAITGSGCQATAMVAAFHALTPATVEAATSGLAVMAVAAEHAARQAEGPGSLSWRLLDQLYNLDTEAFKTAVQIKETKGSWQAYS